MDGWYPLFQPLTLALVVILSLSRHRNIRHAFRTILKEEGGFWSGCLYRGLFPTLLGIAPYVGLNFAVYETLKGRYIFASLPGSSARGAWDVTLDNYDIVTMPVV